MNVQRIHRVIKLISLLQSGVGYTAGALAKECGVGRRTIFRDLNALRAAGVEVRFDEQAQQYSLARNHLLPPTNLAPDEALALVVLCHELGGDGRMPFQSAARQAAIKIENLLPARLRAELRLVTGAMQIRLPSVQRINPHNGAYHALVAALRKREAVRIQYDSYAEQRRVETTLHPYRLLFHNHSWYVIGKSQTHRAVRTFHVGRILNLEPLAERFRPPRNFSLENYLGNAWRMIRSDGPDRDVHVRFAKLVARNVAEVHWHSTQRTQQNDDGTLDFFVRVSGVDEISWWILGYGDQAEVIAPADLRAKIAARVRGMMGMYGIEGA